MTEYRFRVVVTKHLSGESEILDLADQLAEAGCDDGNLCGHDDGLEVVFDRLANSRDEAMRSAVQQIESCGLEVTRVELDRESIAPLSA